MLPTMYLDDVEMWHRAEQGDVLIAQFGCVHGQWLMATARHDDLVGKGARGHDPTFRLPFSNHFIDTQCISTEPVTVPRI